MGRRCLWPSRRPTALRSTGPTPGASSPRASHCVRCDGGRTAAGCNRARDPAGGHEHGSCRCPARSERARRRACRATPYPSVIDVHHDNGGRHDVDAGYGPGKSSWASWAPTTAGGWPSRSSSTASRSPTQAPPARSRMSSPWRSRGHDLRQLVVGEDSRSGSRREGSIAPVPARSRGRGRGCRSRRMLQRR